MAVSYAPIPGRVCSVSIQTPQLLLPFNRFMTDSMADLIDVSAFTSNGFREFMFGMKSNYFVFAGIMNAQWNPFINAPVLKIGTFVSNVVVSMVGSLQSTAPSAGVSRWQISATPTGETAYICSLTADGQFFDFGGSVA